MKHDPNLLKIVEAYTLDCLDFCDVRMLVKPEFSRAGVMLVEEVLDQAHKELITAAPPPETIQLYYKMFGSFLGETLRKNFGGTWGVSDTGEVALQLPSGLCFPWARAKKRILNGYEDNVLHWYDFIATEEKHHASTSGPPSPPRASGQASVATVLVVAPSLTETPPHPLQSTVPPPPPLPPPLPPFTSPSNQRLLTPQPIPKQHLPHWVSAIVVLLLLAGIAAVASRVNEFAERPRVALNLDVKARTAVLLGKATEPKPDPALREFQAHFNYLLNNSSLKIVQKIFGKTVSAEESTGPLNAVCWLSGDTIVCMVQFPALEKFKLRKDQEFARSLYLLATASLDSIGESDRASMQRLTLGIYYENMNRHEPSGFDQMVGGNIKWPVVRSSGSELRDSIPVKEVEKQIGQLDFLNDSNDMATELNRLFPGLGKAS